VNGNKRFDSRFSALVPFALGINNQAIKDEPMFFNSDLRFAREKGGPITREFVGALPDEWFDEPAVFDSRVHMLMPGWYPAIPGYHHDDVPRPPIQPGRHFITAGQPDYDTPKYRSEHILGLVNAPVAPTSFAVGSCVMPEVPNGELIYRRWHAEVERLLEAGDMQAVETPDRTLVYFDCDSFHTGTRAVSSGWRWFGRVSRNTDRAANITNEIRRQVQVYLEFPMEGW
jgi:hypothetical protein